jgi:hypothetical protein
VIIHCPDFVDSQGKKLSIGDWVLLDGATRYQFCFDSRRGCFALRSKSKRFRHRRDGYQYFTFYIGDSKERLTIIKEVKKTIDKNKK